MITKELMVNAVSDLPDNASIEDAMEKLLLLTIIHGSRLLSSDLI